jgi:hypothetical protein
MSKKQLLTEGEIRRFMKYANLGPLSENFLSEVGMQDEGMYEEEGMDDMGGKEEMPAEEPAPAPSGDLSVDEGDLAQMIKDAVKAALAEAGVGEGEAAGLGEQPVSNVSVSAPLVSAVKPRAERRPRSGLLKTLR